MKKSALRQSATKTRSGLKRLAEKYGIPNVYADYNEMLKEIPLDFVSVCLPNDLHEPVAAAALQAGVHVHCEKPLSLAAIPYAE